MGMYSVINHTRYEIHV